MTLYNYYHYFVRKNKIALRFKLKGLLAANNETQEENIHIQEDFTENYSTTTKQYENFRNNAVSKVQTIVKMETSGLGFQRDTDSYIDKLENGDLRCNECGKEIGSRNKMQDMRSHVETHMKGLSYNCEFCEKTFRSKNSLKSHKSHQHKQ